MDLSRLKQYDMMDHVQEDCGRTSRASCQQRRLSDAMVKGRALNSSICASCHVDAQLEHMQQSSIETCGYVQDTGGCTPRPSCQQRRLSKATVEEGVLQFFLLIILEANPVMTPAAKQHPDRALRR